MTTKLNQTTEDFDAISQAWEVLQSGITTSRGGKKFYYFDSQFVNPTKWTAEFASAFKSAPPQMKAMIAYMAKNNLGPDNAATGKEIVNAMKVAGFKTKIESDVLFAYYIRKMEKVGVKLK